MRPRRAVCLLLAFAFAACGGESDTGAGLRLADFPSGWTQQGTRDDESTCQSFVAAKQAAKSYNRSPDFEKREGMIATSTVFHYADEAAAQAAFKTLAGETTAACLATSLGAKGSTRFEVAPAGDERAALRATVPATKGHPGGVFDLVIVRSGTGVAELVLAGVKFPFDERLRDQLTANVAKRLRT